MEVLKPVLKVPAQLDWQTCDGPEVRVKQLKEYTPSACLRTYLNRIIYFNMFFEKEGMHLSPISNGRPEWTMLTNGSRFKMTIKGEDVSLTSYVMGVQSIGKAFTLIPVAPKKNMTGYSVEFTFKGLFELFGLHPKMINSGLVASDHLVKGHSIIEDLLTEGSTIEEGFELIVGFIKGMLKHRARSRLKSVRTTLLSLDRKVYTSIGEMVKDSGVAYRTLSRVFKDILGITPKEYLMITRFDRVSRFMHTHDKPDLTEVVTRFGYYDQAHFAHEFKAVMGVSVTDWMKTTRRHLYLNRAYRVM